jgi:exodeoxyribonuclease VII small subunit
MVKPPVLLRKKKGKIELTKKTESFEQALEKLEKLVQQLESGEIGLENSMKKFEEGQELIKFCLSKLNKAESQVKILEKDQEGHFQVNLFDKPKE